MNIKLKFKFMEKPAEFDTKTLKLIDIPGRGRRPFGRDEMDAELSIDVPGGMNYCIAEIHTGDVDSANALCKEIVRRFNEFPAELKQ